MKKRDRMRPWGAMEQQSIGRKSAQRGPLSMVVAIVQNLAAVFMRDAKNFEH